jgi:superfamily II DNA/RNA helicase
MSASPEQRFNSVLPPPLHPTPSHEASRYDGCVYDGVLSSLQMLGPSPTTTMSEWSAGTIPATTAMRWEAIGLSPALARGATSCGFGATPSKIQAKTIPTIFQDQDIVVQAASAQDRLGSYILPALTYLSAPVFAAAANAIQCLVITSTVEQASQAQRLFTALGARASLSVNASGIDLTAELANLQTRPPQVLIGTPERLLDLLALRSLAMHALRFLVIDEADNLVARGLADYVLSLVRLLPPSAFNGGRQTAIFASSVPQEVLTFASSLHLREPVRVLVRRETAAAGGDIAPSVRGIRCVSV